MAFLFFSRQKGKGVVEWGYMMFATQTRYTTKVVRYIKLRLMRYVAYGNARKGEQQWDIWEKRLKNSVLV